MSSGTAGSGAVSWQKAVGALTAERGRAEAAVAVIKRFGGEEDAARAALTYADGRAEADAVIGVLRVALEQGGRSDAPQELEARLRRAVAAREALATQAEGLIARAEGEKGVLADLLVKALPSLLAAVGALWRRGQDRDAVLRKTVAARLEAARWPPFAGIGER